MTSSASTRSFTQTLKAWALILLLCAAAMASSRAYADWWNFGTWKTIHGSGNIKTETRAISNFTGIALAVNGLVEIQQGNKEGLTIEADDNILPYLEIVIENNTLKIRSQPRKISFKTDKLRFIVYAKNIELLEIAGVGDIHAEALKSNALKASIAGAGNIKLKSLEVNALQVAIAGSGDFAAFGHANTMDARIAGAGDIRTGKLESKIVKIDIAGAGDATVWAREMLNVSIAGAGDVRYFGDAEVRKSIAGMGSVVRQGKAPAGM